MSTNLASLLKYWVGSMERLRIFEKWKVWKGFHGKEEGVVLSMDLKGFWIWKRSTQSHFVWEGPMSINLASHHDPWTTEEVYCGRSRMWKMQSPKRMKGKGRGSCPQYEFERVLNLEEVEFWGEVLWEGPMSTNLASLLRYWVVTMEREFVKNLKNTKSQKN